MKLTIQKILRRVSIMFDDWTKGFVIDQSAATRLIENTKTPNYDAYYSMIEEAKEKWEDSDGGVLYGLEVKGRFNQFKRKEL